MLYLAYFQVISVFLLLLLTSQVVGFFSLFDLIFDIFYIFGIYKLRAFNLNEMLIYIVFIELFLGQLQDIFIKIRLENTVKNS